MDQVLYFLARAVVAFLQALPLVWVARLGRAGGAVGDEGLAGIRFVQRGSDLYRHGLADMDAPPGVRNA